MNKKIEDFSELELRAMKGDIYEQIAQAQQNLQLIIGELSKRHQAKQVPQEPKEDNTKIEEVEKKK